MAELIANNERLRLIRAKLNAVLQPYPSRAAFEAAAIPSDVSLLHAIEGGDGYQLIRDEVDGDWTAGDGSRWSSTRIATVEEMENLRDEAQDAATAADASATAAAGSATAAEASAGAAAVSASEAASAASAVAPAVATAAQIGSAGDVVNTVGKFVGRLVVDTTNNRMLYASGTSATAIWYVVDGSASITPA